eukprot:947756-Prorocentrum_minimum.AAC.2
MPSTRTEVRLVRGTAAANIWGVNRILQWESGLIRAREGLNGAELNQGRAGSRSPEGGDSPTRGGDSPTGGGDPPTVGGIHRREGS